jgi:hypothetical protein
VLSSVSCHSRCVVRHVLENVTNIRRQVKLVVKTYSADCDPTQPSALFQPRITAQLLLTPDEDMAAEGRDEFKTQDSGE